MSAIFQMRSILSLAILLGLLVAFSACASKELTVDKKAMAKVKKVAVVMYSVPLTIKVREDPRKRDESQTGTQALLKMASSAFQAGNGGRAATLSLESFIGELNKQGLSFQAISLAEMQSNSRFSEMALKYNQKVMAQIAKEREEREKKMGAAGKVLGFMSKMGGGGGSVEKAIGIGPEGIPSFGLVGNWFDADTALMNVADEKVYLREAVAALNVDAVLVLNDPGYSLNCKFCVGGNGNAGTQSAFMGTIVDKQGRAIMTVRQWFNIGDGNAAMVAGVINPLQYDNLFRGHGRRTAVIFARAVKNNMEK